MGKKRLHKLHISLVLFISNSTVKMKLTMLAFFYSVEFVKKSCQGNFTRHHKTTQLNEATYVITGHYKIYSLHSKSRLSKYEMINLMTKARIDTSYLLETYQNKFGL